MSARDRALSAVDEAIYNVNPLAHDEETAAAEAVAAVDALLAQPEVLRALAGAPTADVAARFRAAAEVAERMGADAAAHVFGALSVKAKHHPHDVEGIVSALFAAAPEGVDAADANRCSACERSLRRCCYTCPHCDRHEDTCEGVDAVDGTTPR